MEPVNYPEKTCSIELLVRHEKLVAAVIAGTKTQQRRAGVYGYPGEIFSLKRKRFIILSLRHETLGMMTEHDALQEGYENLGAYRDLILRMHPGMAWDEQMKVWVHEFREQV